MTHGLPNYIIDTIKSFQPHYSIRWTTIDLGLPYCPREIWIQGGCPDIGNYNGKALGTGVPELTLGPVMLPGLDSSDAGFPGRTPKDRED